jgi:hypothetical protein
MSNRAIYFILALTLFCLEILIATKLSAFPFIRGSLGDFLVVILLFFSVKAVREVRPYPLAAAVFLFACLIETAQFFHLADTLGFPRGSIPSIVLGNSFSSEDILMYGLGSLAAAFLDQFIFRQ